jgi:hypothetical protein
MIRRARELGDRTVLDEGNNAHVSGIVIRIAHGLLSRLLIHAALFTNSIT